MDLRGRKGGKRYEKGEKEREKREEKAAKRLEFEPKVRICSVVHGYGRRTVPHPPCSTER